MNLRDPYISQDFQSMLIAKSCKRYFSTIAVLIVFSIHTGSAYAAWVRVTCKSDYQYTISIPVVSCSRFNVLEDERGYFIPGFSRAMADRQTDRLSTSSGGGSIRGVGFNGGESTAFLRKTFNINRTWRGWLPVTVNFVLDYKFVGYGESQLTANLVTFDPSSMAGNNRTGIVLRYHGFNKATLVHSRTEGNVLMPDEGAYSGQGLLILSAIHLVHHSTPTLDARVDLLTWSLPNLGSLGYSVTSSADVDARVDIVIPDMSNRTGAISPRSKR